MSIHALDDTIAAIATPLGMGGIGIVRLSGPQAAQILCGLFRPLRQAADWQPRYLYLGGVYDVDERRIDQCLAVLMPAPNSYTGDDVAELQCHGGPQVLSQVLQSAIAAGARLAEPGEITLRAFLNGNIDLAQAEAVADIIEAKTPDAALLAAGQLAGSLSAKLAAIETELLDIIARITVGVDFPDDVDAPENAPLIAEIERVASAIDKLLANAHSGRIYREGLRVTLAGAVNVGKSSLLNALLSEDRAIVSACPGTTRDIIEEYIDIQGLPVKISDTAGIRETGGLDEAESIGIGKSKASLAAAQLLLLIIDAGREPDQDLRQLIADTAAKTRLIVINKSDIVDASAIEQLKNTLLKGIDGQDIIIVSAKQHQGIEELKLAIRRKAMGSADAEKGSQLINNIRHQQALLRARSHIEEALVSLYSDFPADMASIDLENACSAIGEISGKEIGEEVLNTIFSKFCLGK